MELDYTQGFCQAPTSLYRKESNLTMRESATLTYLLSHREGFKVSYRRMSKDLHSDFRTVKKVIEKLKTKGYEELVNKVLLNYNTTTPKCSNNSTLNKNSNTTNTTKKLQHFINKQAKSKEKARLKKFTQNKVLEHVSGGAVELQQGCCICSNTIILIKYINTELIKEKIKIKISKVYKKEYPCVPKKEIPLLEEVIEKKPSIKEQDITIKEGVKLKDTTYSVQKVELPAFTTTLKQTPTPTAPTLIEKPIVPVVTKEQQTIEPRDSKEPPTLKTTTVNSNLVGLLKKVKPEYVETKAEELPLTIPEEFLTEGKEINQSIDLYNEYQQFRNNKINKKHTNSNWINAWKSWLIEGKDKYKKGINNMTYIQKKQPSTITLIPLTEEKSEEQKLEEYKAFYNKAKEWMLGEGYEISEKRKELFLEKLGLERELRNQNNLDIQTKVKRIKKEISELDFRHFEKTEWIKQELQKLKPGYCNVKGYQDLLLEEIEYCKVKLNEKLAAQGLTMEEYINKIKTKYMV